ncbi:Transposon Tf2-8 polyprotein [Vitis vinifera]|uniref:Transposon Tf2-8 polyprotein n=1 Tax=Vitis vinifera TaxID=29760 RepID=A0A438E5B6_VITVI|nr:Transposon Tf2-8 polyprotein [Vitis vinifera]
MGTNKERIEQLKDGLHRMEVGMADRLRQVEENLNRLSDVLFANSENPILGSITNREGNGGGRLVDGFSRGRILKTNSGLVLGLRSAKILMKPFADKAGHLGCLSPQTLKEAISLARMKDDQLARQRRFGRLAPPTRAPLSLPPTQLATPPALAAPVRRLSWEEMQRRRAQNLCFNCNDRFTIGHKCLGPQILLLEGYEDNGDLLCDEVTKKQPAGQNHEGSPEPEITLHALMGWTVPKTMRIAARIGAHDVVVLIDSGSTHNFISERMANLLRLPMVPTESFTVRVANGENLRCQGRFEEELTMEFMWENQTKKLVGIDGQHIQAASIEELTKEIRPSHAQFALCLQVAHTEPQQNIHSSMREILQEFSDLFTEPSSLPPTWEVDHSIALKEGTEPINVRPYNTNPFSSPVLLVKKKDGNWRFYTDYRALNAATIKDRFPIPTVDDMWMSSTVLLILPSLICERDTISPDWDQHLVHVRQTFEILRQHRFFVKTSKCAFGQQELEYLGHIIIRKGVKVDENKIAAMFIKYYGIIARPLTNLLKKGQFGWHGEAETAFLALKQAMTTTLILAMPNFNDVFTIETDASGEGIGAVLSQQGKPVAYMSRVLGVTKKSWSTLKYLLEQRIATSEQQEWVAKLLGYDYKIKYKPGRENSTADAPSRKQGSPILHNIFFPQVSLWEEIKKVADEDQYIQSNVRMATEQPGGSYTWCQGLLLYKGRVIVPNVAALRAKLLHEMHDTKVGGHSSFLRTFKKLGQQFYWPGMHRSMQDYVKGCAVCQKIKAENLVSAGLLQPLPIPCQVWDDITLDFIEGLPISRGKDTIMVVVDRLSKSAHFLTLSHPFTAKTIAEKFVEGVFKLHGMPKSIISDQDPILISNFWKEFFTMSGSKLQLSSAYHPQTDGQTEVINRCVEQYLRSFALYGRLSPPIPPYKDGLSPVHEVDQQLLNRDELLRQLKVNLERSMNRMKQMADRKRRDISFGGRRTGTFEVTPIPPANGLQTGPSETS